MLIRGKTTMRASKFSKIKNSCIDGLAGVIEERGQRILERFGQVTISGVHNSKLLEILNDVKSYWRDLFRPSLTSFSCEAVGGEPEMADEAGLIFTLASSG